MRMLKLLQSLGEATDVTYIDSNNQEYDTTIGAWLDRHDGDSELAENVIRVGNEIFYTTGQGEPFDLTSPVFRIYS